MVKPMEKLNIRFSDKPVTAWGGLRLMKELLDQCGLREELRRYDLPEPGSNRGYDPLQIIESFWVSLWCGASRFAHCGYLRYDQALQDIFEWSSAPSQSTYSRFFHKFTQARNHAIFPSLQQDFFQQWQLKQPLTLDLDSTVVTRYGSQQGAAKGYNPQKPGRPSHHPLMAFVPEGRLVVNAWMRPGNTHDMSGFEGFMHETLGILTGANHQVGLLRADSGFFSGNNFDFLEERGINYVVAGRFYPWLRSEITSLKKWSLHSDGIEVSEMAYQAHNWDKPRRMIVVRQAVAERPTATGKLFDDLDPKYRYSLLVTSLDLPAAQIWQLYRGRADAENRIKELKYDFGADQFCLKDFWATEAAFRFMLVGYNLLALFRLAVIQEGRQKTLQSLRFQCFAIGSWMSTHAGQRTLTMSLSRKRRPWIGRLFEETRNLSPPYTVPNA